MEASFIENELLKNQEVSFATQVRPASLSLFPSNNQR